MIVPREPTQEMLDAGAESIKDLMYVQDMRKNIAARVWRAMVAVLHAEIPASAGPQAKE